MTHRGRSRAQAPPQNAVPISFFTAPTSPHDFPADLQIDCFWPIAPFWCAAKFSRYRGIADSAKRTAEARGDQVSTAPAV